MQTLLQILASIEALAKALGPTVGPVLITALEALKAKYSEPWEVALINAAEAVIRSNLVAPPAAPAIGD